MDKFTDTLTLFYFDGQAIHSVSILGINGSDADEDFISHFINTSDYDYPPCGYAIFDSEFGITFDYEIARNRAPDYFTIEYIENRIREMFF